MNYKTSRLQKVSFKNPYEYSRQQLKKVRATFSNYFADYSIEQNGQQLWVEHPVKRLVRGLSGIRDALSESIHSGHWDVPRFGEDRTAYIIGLFGSGRLYLDGLIQENCGQRARYLRDTIRCHQRPTSMIYTGHATMRYASRGQRLPTVTGRIMESVRLGYADLVFIYRHPLDSLITNWVWWRTYLGEKRNIHSIGDVHKTTDELCVALEQDFREFEAFANGDAQLFAGTRGPRFLSLSEFVEETELFIQSSTISLRFEDFAIDPLCEFLKVARVMSLPVARNTTKVSTPRAKPFGHLLVQEKVPRFAKFINDLDLDTRKRIERIGYTLNYNRTALPEVQDKAGE